MHDKRVPVATAWRVLRLRMEERPPIWRSAANILNNQSRKDDKGGPPAWWLGEVLTTPHRKKNALLRNRYMCMGPGLVLWYDLRREKGT